MRLARINNLLLALIVLINLYVIVLPLIPSLVYLHGRHSAGYEKLVQKVERPAPASPSPAKMPRNSIIFPEMLLDAPILEGRNTYAVLDQGILHWPASSTPDQGGNTVLVGHRFTYKLPKGVFYNLDKASLGDTLGVRWNGTLYRYLVTQIKTVPPSDTSILSPTTKSTLTLYTCTPLWHPTERLVVIAELENTP